MVTSKKITSLSVQHRKNPFLSLQEEFNKAVGTLYNMTGLRHFPFASFENLALHPSVDIVDDKDNFKVVAEMPGLSEKEIRVSIQDGALIIKGEKETSRKDKGKNYILREIGYGRYERMISLPESVNTENATASFKKGMLWVNIPKKTGSAQPQSRDLKIEKI